MKDFPSKQPAPQNVTAIIRDPHDQGPAPTTGFNDAPLTPQNRGAAGPGVPASKRKIH